ncbi:MAG: hypothetical protein JXA73_00155 [Acidobacteria bacterium]|nr:hypothetical protein [Acidobacteriota bacterium]
METLSKMRDIEYLIERQHSIGIADDLVRSFLADDRAWELILSICRDATSYATAEQIEDRMMQWIVAQKVEHKNSLGRPASLESVRAKCRLMAHSIVSYRRRAGIDGTNGNGHSCQCSDDNGHNRK